MTINQTITFNSDVQAKQNEKIFGKIWPTAFILWSLACMVLWPWADDAIRGSNSIHYYEQIPAENLSVIHAFFVDWYISTDDTGAMTWLTIASCIPLFVAFIFTTGMTEGNTKAIKTLCTIGFWICMLIPFAFIALKIEFLIWLPG